MVLLRSAAASLSDLDGLSPGYDVPGGQVLGDWGISLHEPLAFRVDEESTLSAAALCHQTTCSVDASWVELNELHVLNDEQQLYDDCCGD